jgi:hypothetical protein
LRRLAAALSCLALGATGAGCGSDDEPTDTTEPPLPALPQGSPAPETGTDTSGDPADTTEDSPPADGAPTDPTAPSGGTPAPTPDAPEDSPSNDVAPEPGSPESRFEDACDQNPDACG